MFFKQKVILKNIDITDVIQSFHDRRFVDFLTALQPVQIKNWNGIENNKKAAFSFWFFGWKDIKVVHKNYEVSGTHLHFEDKGLELPFELLEWHHHHIVQSYKDGAMIIDKVQMNSNRSIGKFFIYGIMLFPILIRRITYRIWFYWVYDD